VVVLAKLKPRLMPPLTAEERHVPLPAALQQLADTVSKRALPGLLAGLKGRRNQDVPAGYLLKQLAAALLPAVLYLLVALWAWDLNTRPGDAPPAPASSGLQEPGSAQRSVAPSGGLAEPPGASSGGLAEPPGSSSGGLAEPPGSSSGGLAEPPGSRTGSLSEPPGTSSAGLAEPPGSSSGGLSELPAAAPGGLKEPPGAGGGLSEPPGASGGLREPGAVAGQAPSSTSAMAAPERRAPSTGYWIGAGVGALALLAFYAMLSFQHFEIFKMLLGSFFPLLVLILAVLGSIVFGLATPTEAAAVGAFGGFLLAVAYKQFNMRVLKESVFLTAKTSAMVCWLFVGSAIFSAAFALLGGQELVENWVMSLDLTKTQFLVLSQVIIFMPIFIPLLDNFGVDPLFFGLLVALNLQTAFLSPPVAMAAFYLKGVSPPHVTLNQIFAGMLPFMGIQVVAIVLLYQFPAIGMWLPQVLYR
jgi:TRAP-type mannitol/chloroaromatic compound transport system permease large subunit